MAYRPVALFCVYPMRLLTRFSDDMADDLRTHLKLWGTKRAFGISIRRFAKTQPSNAMIETLLRVRKQHDQCFQQRRISVSCKSETWSVFRMTKNHRFSAAGNMISVSNDKKTLFFRSKKHDQCFESRKIIVFLQQETWSVFRITKNHCFAAARNIIRA